MKSCLRFIFVFLVCSLPLFSEITPSSSPHLILYFDINKTLIASDKAGGKSVEDVLNELLSEKYEGIWDRSRNVSMTFHDYVHKILVPKSNDHLITNLREQRQSYTQHFINYLRTHDHPLYAPVLKDYESALTMLNTSNSIIFPSFYSLLNDLDQKGTSYSIILRSYGEEIYEVRDEIDAVYKKIFNQSGKFRKGKLFIGNNESLDSSQAIYNQLRRIDHTAIHDDWKYWNAHNMSSAYGKPFYVDKDDKETLCIFFDDNISLKGSSRNIIAPMDAATNAIIPVKELVESGQAVSVDTLKAVLDLDYYIDLVEQALEKHSR
ncbi:MAG TPA: hypothetical protein VGP47_08595 [Parachlamydiaceae bacterium]|nr:hypothetical protein [Parachlamydiaceae bacterium]